MTKELEALNKIQHDFGQLKGQELVSCYETIFNALKRLESIDNAEPSEALECLDRIDNTLCLNNIKGTIVFGIDDEEHCDCDSVIGMVEDLETIKQALLKAEKEHNSVNLLMQELDCKDMETLRKYARCGYQTFRDGGIMNKPNHKKYALLDDGTIEPLYYDVNDTLDWDNLRHIELDDNGEHYCLFHDKWVVGGIALCVNKIIKEADTIEELEKCQK